MSLKQYQTKRKFSITPEPKGEVNKKSLLRYVVQEHQARNLHYDFRLEIEGVLKSWAVPKGIPTQAGIKRLAVQVEDHPVDYINFTGVIPKGEYGAGVVKIWDKGKYKIIEGDFAKGNIKFKLNGKKMGGNYVLVKLKDKKNWLLFKAGK